MEHIMILERWFDRETRQLGKLLAVARTGDEINLSGYSLKGEEIEEVHDVHLCHGRFVVEIKEGEVSPRSNEYFKQLKETKTGSPRGNEWGDEEGRPYRSGDLPSRYYLLSEDLSSSTDCGLHGNFPFVYPAATGFFWCDWKGKGIYYSDSRGQAMKVYDSFLESAIRPPRVEGGESRFRIKKDVWQIDSMGTIYVKTLHGFTRIRTKDGQPIESVDILSELSERREFPFVEWGVYGDSLWIHHGDGLLRVGPDGQESFVPLLLEFDRRWGHDQYHGGWVARDGYLGVHLDGLLYVFKDSQLITRFVDLPGIPKPQAISESGLVYSHEAKTYGADEWKFVGFDGKTTSLHLHSHLDDCWITDKGVLCLDIGNLPALIVMK